MSVRPSASVATGPSAVWIAVIAASSAVEGSQYARGGAALPSESGRRGALRGAPPARLRECRLLLLVAVPVGGSGLRAEEALRHRAHGVAAVERHAVSHRAGE